MILPITIKYLYTLVTLISTKSRQGWKNLNTTINISQLQFSSIGISIMVGAGHYNNTRKKKINFNITIQTMKRILKSLEIQDYEITNTNYLSTSLKQTMNLKITTSQRSLDDLEFRVTLTNGSTHLASIP